ncbi:hypothetical protein HPULCUR_004436 [Helicostylum pulchrum]|uniref:Uncharacterized protein n=1 Tax=Helicostylum pulchrum TaxID=562976 RepID=A0ABP9XY98_9FUNG
MHFKVSLIWWYLWRHVLDRGLPLDLVKALIRKETLQRNPTCKNAKHYMQDIYSRNGIAGFYRGISVTLIRYGRSFDEKYNERSETCHL